MMNDRFITLFIKELCGQLSENEREELRLLLQDNPEFRTRRELLKEYWERDKGEYEANTAMFKRVIEKIKVEENQVPLRKLSRVFWYGAAAAVLLIAGFTAWYVISPKASPRKEMTALQWLEKTTRATKKSVLTLPDGTVVTLNSATTLKYPAHFGDSTREVYLEGEAYFSVSKDPVHPFIIHADKMNIRVLGTAFNIKSYRSEPSGEATLITGSIEVTLNDRPSDRIILKPKEKLIVQNNGMLKKAIIPDLKVEDTVGKSTRYSLTNLTYFPNNVKTVVETSWVENKLVFSEKDFADLSGQLERWYGVHIEFQNEKVKQYNFTGFFEKESLPEALDALKMIEHFNYRIMDSVVYIY
jgi:ferric-dicitrate binding protein FerR (iron transport regulator)